MRRFLVYCPVRGNSSYVPELFGPNRTFDVALNSYTGDRFTSGAEYFFTEKTQKLLGAARNFPSLPRYDAYALLDDDIEVTTRELDELFEIGMAHRLQLWQPSLTAKSYVSFEATRQVPGRVVREEPFVEMMAPFFSREALERCLPTFGVTLVGWELDLSVWPRLVGGRGIGIVDRIPVGHYRKIQSEGMRLSHGLSPRAEGSYVSERYKRLDLWRYAKDLYRRKRPAYRDEMLTHVPLYIACAARRSPDAGLLAKLQRSWKLFPIHCPKPIDEARMIVEAAERHCDQRIAIADLAPLFEDRMVFYTLSEGRDLLFGKDPDSGTAFVSMRATPEVIAFWRAVYEQMLEDFSAGRSRSLGTVAGEVLGTSSIGVVTTHDTRFLSRTG